MPQSCPTPEIHLQQPSGLQTTPSKGSLHCGPSDLPGSMLADSLKKPLKSGIESIRSSLPSSASYRPLPTADADGQTGVHKTQQSAGRFSILRQRLLQLRFVLALLSLLLLLLLLYLLLPLVQSKDAPLPPYAFDLTAHHFHLLIPASQPEVNLCKTLLSAGVLNYPPPILINWNVTFDNPQLVSGGSHLAKINGVLGYLQRQPQDRDEDLVFMVDGYDSWFQLRPSVLIARYRENIDKGNQRIRKQLGRAADAEGIQQKVVFATQKRCWPREASDPACYLAPESTLPKKAYGRLTDTDVGFQPNPYLKYRQRFLNSGSVMGTVAAMRVLFERALEIANADPNFGSDQNIFAQIFGMQEFQREVIRRRHLSDLERLSARLGSYLPWNVDVLEPAENRKVYDHKDGTPDEFGIGLDYESSLGHATVFAEEDSAWLTSHNKSSLITAASAIAQPPWSFPPPSLASNLYQIDQDILASSPPFSALHETPGLPAVSSWSSVPLFTNLWTGIVPATIHHNAHRDGMKSRREEWWPNMWYYEGARALMSAHLSSPLGPSAVLRDWKGGNETAYWPLEVDNGMARSRTEDPDKPSESWLAWTELCGAKEVEDEVFRDGRGAEQWMNLLHTNSFGEDRASCGMVPCYLEGPQERSL